MRQFGLYPPRALGGCGGLSLVREDRDGRTAGEPVVCKQAPPGSYVRTGEPLKASKWEPLPKTSPPAHEEAYEETPPEDHRVGGRQVDGGQPTGAEPFPWRTPPSVSTQNFARIPILIRQMTTLAADGR